MATVSSIDLTAYYQPGAARGALSALVAEVDRALRDIGFLCIRGHPVPAAIIEQTQEVALRFFASAPAHKRSALAVRHKHRGYTPLGDIALSYAMRDGDDPQPPDLFERYRIGPFDFAADEYHLQRAEGAYAPNVWPAQLPEFQSCMSAYYLRMSQLSRDLMRIFALALDLDEHWFDTRIDREMSSLCLNHYPAPQAEPLPGQQRAAAHTDYGTLTIVAPTAAPGALQVHTRDGRWETVVVEPGTFVVNIGDMMAQWTNDRWVSTLHRVANPRPFEAPRSQRLSLVYFHQPNPDAVVSCIPTCVSDERPARYAPVTAGDYISRRISMHFKSGAAAVPESR
jgi:isopenicillin N synthase-like dioxygenase